MITITPEQNSSMNRTISQNDLLSWKLKYKQRSSRDELIDHFKGKVIVLGGIPGSGKSTLGEQLAEELGGTYYPEYIQKDLFDLYLADKKRYAFSYQIIMARERINTVRRAHIEASQGKAVIIDGPLVCDNAFAKMMWQEGCISDEEYEVYQKVLDAEIGDFIPSPDYPVYLDTSIPQALAKIKVRGRRGEYEAYKNGFLEKLRDAFQEVLSGYEIIRLPYEEDNAAKDYKIPKNRLLEILGLIRDRTFKSIGLDPQ